ncbi:type IV secretion system protein [Sphingomonas sp. ASV193]|uniref:type IV secretion system protein n=1 Tax=Sphingomonas sp. ASV193 TaxID=3144405 RepID=UPI0032E93563
MIGSCSPDPNGAFLTTTLSALDCQGRTIGAWGFANMASSGIGNILLSTALALLIAVAGIHLMFGGKLQSRDIGWGSLRIALVLTLALSWPAVRLLVYDAAFDGPAELASAIDGSTSSNSPPTLARLERVDQGFVALSAAGTGRDEMMGLRTVDGQPSADAFRGMPIADQIALGGARFAYLSGLLVTFGITRLGAGLLIALLPLFAPLLLFDTTRALFGGWVRTLVGLALANAALIVTTRLELSLLEPWLQNALNLRASYYATPSAPTELLVITVSFGAIGLGIAALMLRICWQFAASLRVAVDQAVAPAATHLAIRPERANAEPAPERVAHSIRETMIGASLARDANYRERLASSDRSRGSGGSAAHEELAGVPGINSSANSPRTIRASRSRARRDSQ